MESRPVIASILTIGDELLIGQTVDTNSAWMSQELNEIGVWVHRRVSVGDDREAIWQALDEESRQAQIILLTGGLGPTADDITKPLLCQYFGGRMVVDPDALANVKHIFEMLKRPLIERNLKQAEVPDVCTVIPNRRGTAPGMWFEKEGRIFVSMPGVPYEMKGMMKAFVLPRLLAHFQPTPVVHRTLLTAGIGESFLAERIHEFEWMLPKNIKLAYLPSYGMVRLRLTGRGADAGLKAELEAQFNMLQQLVADVMVTNEDQSISQVLGKILTERGQTLSSLESCTGGYIGHLITSIPGSSRYYLGGGVAYSNALKISTADVRPETLAAHGAVSRETVVEMAEGIRRRTGSDFAIATSGILGPDGGTPEKLLGTVWVGLSAEGRQDSSHFHFRFDRQRNTELAANHGLNALRKFILG